MQQNVYSYKIIEYNDGYLCAVFRDNELFGNTFQAKTREQMFSWLRLVSGSYPGSCLNDEVA